MPCPPCNHNCDQGRTCPARLYFVKFGARDNPRLEFEAMGTDSAAVTEQHMELALPGERMEVFPATY